MSTTDHRVHGLAADEIAPDWPPLTATEVATLLERYPGLVAPRTIHWHSPRPLSAAALVDTAGGRVFVKRHHASVRTTTTLSEEHRFIAWLRAAGMPIPAVLADRDGHTAIAIDDSTYEVHASAAGIDIYRDTMSWVPLRELRHAHTAGTMLARLHDAAEGYAAPQRDCHRLVARSDLIEADDPLQALAAQLPQRPALAAYLAGRDWQREIAAAVAPFHAVAQPQLARQPRLWTHGDWHVSNLCWSSDAPDARIEAVLDFGLSARSFALFDLATAVERNAIAWLEVDGDIGHHDVATALLSGYHAVRPLERDQRALLAALLPMVHLDFALSEVEYFCAATHTLAHADVAYDTFLRGHAAWFRTPYGQALLETIREG
ncbi:phosphotransferase enzyme family protein [Dyella sp. A6]|uniref:phosphotransferase enzyme family protein n=1 Tax=Dyella aluminiiresistens TaxID=3069105 RepID=UPI002E75E631|nr:phosphotransferase [Dyella sp. A6]